MYADYDYYTDAYGGTLVPVDAWTRVEGAAEQWLTGVTGNRADPEKEPVRKAVCAVAEVLWRQEQGGALKSQTVGSWKQTYADTGNSSLDRRLYETASLWLGNTGLLCRWC